MSNTGLSVLRVRWTGIRPLIMHNGRLAIPADEYTRKIKAVTKANKGSNKTEAKDAEVARLEWEGSLYWDEKIHAYIPADNIERVIQLGAQKSKMGKQIQAAVFCTEDSLRNPVKYDGPKNLDALYATEGFVLTKTVVIQGKRIVRTRPIFPTGWSVEFDLEFDETVVDARTVMTAMHDAGRLIGLGDWRPKFGRFLVEQV
jgi:hypothetical protein